MTEQERFEQWADDKGLYTDERRMAWEGWQAAIESKAVKSCKGCRGCVYDCEGVCALSGHLECIGYDRWEAERPIESKAIATLTAQRDKFRDALVELSRIGPSSNTSGKVRAFASAILEGKE